MNHKGHNAADAAHKGVHQKYKLNPLCPLRLCGSIRSAFQRFNLTG